MLYAAPIGDILGSIRDKSQEWFDGAADCDFCFYEMVTPLSARILFTFIQLSTAQGWWNALV